MNCKTGMDLFSSFSMPFIKNMACNWFLDLSKEEPGSQFVTYQNELCTIAKHHVTKTFAEFQEAFCKRASENVQITAKLIDQQLRVYSYGIGATCAFATIGLINGADWAGRNGRTTLEKILYISAMLTTVVAATSAAKVLA